MFVIQAIFCFFLLAFEMFRKDAMLYKASEKVKKLIIGVEIMIVSVIMVCEIGILMTIPISLIGFILQSCLLIYFISKAVGVISTPVLSRIRNSK